MSVCLLFAVFYVLKGTIPLWMPLLCDWHHKDGKWGRPLMLVLVIMRLLTALGLLILYGRI
jgi:hypothetical protein